MSCGICGVHTLEFLHFCPSMEKELEKRGMRNDHETCDNKNQVFKMDPKQREWSALQTNFILQMMGFGEANSKAKCLECHCRTDVPKPVITRWCLCTLSFLNEVFLAYL